MKAESVDSITYPVLPTDTSTDNQPAPAHLPAPRAFGMLSGLQSRSNARTSNANRSVPEIEIDRGTTSTAYGPGESSTGRVSNTRSFAYAAGEASRHNGESSVGDMTSSQEQTVRDKYLELVLTNIEGVEDGNVKAQLHTQLQGLQKNLRQLDSTDPSSVRPGITTHDAPEENVTNRRDQSFNDARQHIDNLRDLAPPSSDLLRSLNRLKKTLDEQERADHEEIGSSSNTARTEQAPEIDATAPAEQPESAAHKQSFTYSCGPASLLCVAAELGVRTMPLAGASSIADGPPALELNKECETSLYRLMKNNPENEPEKWGTVMPSDVIRVAHGLGLNARVSMESTRTASLLKLFHPTELRNLQEADALDRLDAGARMPLANSQREMKVLVNRSLTNFALHFVMVRPDGTVMDPADGENYENAAAAKNSYTNRMHGTGISVILEKRPDE